MYFQYFRCSKFSNFVLFFNMAESGIYTVLNSFSAKELRSFRKFLKSPYFNKSQKVLKLLDILLKSGEQEQNPEYRRMIFERIYPGKTYIDSTLRNLFAGLNNQLNEFMMLENFRNSGLGKQKYLSAERLKKNLKEYIYPEVKSSVNSQNFGSDFNYFLNKHFDAQSKFNFSVMEEKITRFNSINTELGYLEDSLRYLKLFYLSQTTQLYTTVSILRQNFDIGILPPSIKKLSEDLDPEKLRQLIPPCDEYYYAVELYEAMVNIYREPDETKYYHEYKNCFYKYVFRISGDECSMHISNLTSYCTGKATSGIEEFNNELFELIELTIKNKYYQNNNTEHLPHEYFRNFLLHGVRLKKFDWVNDFIHENYMKVHPADRENMKQLGFAYLNFNTAQYDEALGNINRISPDFFAFKLDIKNLTVQIFYELGYFEDALVQIKSYKEYLRKDKLLNMEKRKRYFSFLKFTENLVLHRAGTKNTDIGYLRYRISTHKAAAFKPWLMEKVMILDTKAKRSA